MSAKAPRLVRIMRILPLGPGIVVLLLAFTTYPAALDVARERVTDEKVALARQCEIGRASCRERV